MVVAERWTEAPEPAERPESVPVVRVFSVAPVSTTELRQQLDAGISIADIPLTEVLFARKAITSMVSADMLIPFGGEIMPGETVAEAGIRELVEESTLQVTSRTRAEQAFAEHPPAYEYGIVAYPDPRRVHLAVVPVRSRTVSLQRGREGEAGMHDKIAAVVRLSAADTITLLTDGTVISPDDSRHTIVGHLTLAPTDDAFLHPEERGRQRQALEAVIGQIGALEEEFRSDMLGFINRLRVWRGESPADTLTDCTREELLVGFEGTQIEQSLADERQRDRQRRDRPPRMADLLKTQRFFVAEEVTLDQSPELLFAVTGETLHWVNTLKRAYSGTLRTVTGRLYPAADMSDLGRESPLTVSRTIWPDLLSLSVTDRVTIFREANTVFARILADSLHVSAGDLERALRAAADFTEYITRSLQRHPEFGTLYHQDHRPLNEVSNAGLFTLTAMALGFHPNVHLEGNEHHETVRRLRFESLRSLSTVIAAVDVIRRLDTADNSIFEAALDTFLHFPPRQEVLEIGNGRFHPVYHREVRPSVLGLRLDVRVDERLKKTIASAIRKRFQDPDLNDIYSTNIVVAESNFPAGFPIDIADRLAVAEELKRQFIGHIHDVLTPDGWNIEILAGNHWSPYTRVREYLAADAHERSALRDAIRRGKRAGSAGNRILRDKFILVARRGDVTQLSEFCIFPFERLDTTAGEVLRDAGFWGFVEKMQDDAEGVYEAARIFARDMTKAPTEPSLYELLFPDVLYDWLASRLRDRQVVRPRHSP